MERVETRRRKDRKETKVRRIEIPKMGEEKANRRFIRSFRRRKEEEEDFLPAWISPPT